MIAVIDYGVGNLFSLLSSLNYVGLNTKLTNDIEEIKNAKGIILPGVGAFRDAIGNLEKYGLKETLISEAKKRKPFLGICLGMQMAVIEFARHIAGLKGANSTEMNEQTPYPVISLMESQKEITQKGGTMRLGAWACELSKGSKIYEAYGKKEISERHRHRYEFNNDYKEQLEKAGLQCTGINPDTGLVEVIELPNHPWFVGVQYHPEYKSTVANPHPLFVAFVRAALNNKLKKN